jgi:hypothetical protein
MSSLGIEVLDIILSDGQVSARASGNKSRGRWSCRRSGAVDLGCRQRRQSIIAKGIVDDSSDIAEGVAKLCSLWVFGPIERIDNNNRLGIRI